MKRFLLAVLAIMIGISLFSGCNNKKEQETTPSYKVEILNAEDFDILNELKEFYQPGETVTIELSTLTEHYYALYVNGEEIDKSVSDNQSVTLFTFTMPNEDVLVTIEDWWVAIPESPQE